MLKRYWITPIVAASILMAFFFFNLPPPGPAGTPLGWDMSGHLIRSTEMAQELGSFSVGGVIDQLRYWSVYPPFYYLVSGVFQSVFGASPLALLMKMLIWPILVALAWGWGFSSLGRKGAFIAAVGAAWMLADFAQYQALAHCEMLDVPASAMAIFALASVAKFRSDFSSVQAPLQAKPLVLVSLAVSLTLLTKHNAGLPLLIVCGFFFLEAVVVKNKTQAKSFFIITATAATVWVLFLTWQDHGWHSFLNFASNRSNSSGISLGSRGLQYGRIFVDQNIGSGIRAMIVLGFIAMSWRFRKNAFWQACVVYLVTYILAISKHTYFLPRNLVVVMPLMATMVGFGLVAAFSYGRGIKAKSLRIVAKTAPVIIVLIVYILPGVTSHSSRVTAHYKGIFPEKSRSLTEVSAFLTEQMSETNSCMMIGTFNGLSKPWTNLLWLRSAGNVDGKKLPPEPYYPGPHRRTGLDPDYSSDYAPVLQRILKKQSYNTVIGISMDQDSPWWDGDYKHWNAWKMNYVKLLAQHPGLHLEMQRSFPEAGLSVLVYHADKSPVKYGSGWSKAESWGRWAVAEEVEIILPPGSAGSTLHLDICPFADQKGILKGAAFFENETLIDLAISGVPWQWQTYAVKVPTPSKNENGPIRIVFHFENQGQRLAHDDRTLVAPFRNIHLVAP